MNIAGTHIVAASPQAVWQALNDPEVLARCAPGVHELVLEEPGRYRTTLEVAIGPVKGKFKASITIAEPHEPVSMTLKVEARAPVGIVRGEGKIRLEPVDHEGQPATAVHWEGVPHLAGTLATLGARLVQGVARNQADHFFHHLQQEVQQQPSQGG